MSSGRCRSAAVGLLALTLAGCEGTLPDVAIDVPPAFKAGRSGPTPVVRETWVRSFGSAELDRLVAQAVSDNFDLEAAIARIQQAEAQAFASRSALFPIISGTSDVSRQQTGSRSSSLSTSTTSKSVSLANSFSLGLTASYELDLFGKNRFAARALDETARSSRFDRDTLVVSTIATVANTYFTVLASQDRLRIASQNLAIANDVLNAIRGRVSVGTGTALDVAQQEAVVATQRAAVPPLRQVADQDRNTLAVLLGRTPESVSIRGGSLDALRVPSVQPGLPSDLLLRRPDIAEAEANLASAEASVASARAAFFPSITLSTSGGFESAALKSLLGGSSLVYSLGAGLTQPIFEYYNLKGSLDLQNGRVAEYAASYKKAIAQSFADVENALIAVRETANHERLLREAVAASRRAYDISQQRLREGTIDIVTLLATQTTLFSNQDALAQVRLQRMQAVVSLFQALGGGWSPDRAVARIPAAEVVR